jgi:hypothetical protein
MMRNPLAVHIDFKDLQGITGKRIPSNIDMILERHGRFLVGEWKRENEKISIGQQILLKQLAKVDKFTVLVIVGDTDEGMKVSKIWHLKPNESWKMLGSSVNDLKEYIIEWDKNA